jgi:signal transduction histidine kinase
MFENITHQWKQPLSIMSMVSSTIKLEHELGTLDDKSLTKLLDSVDNAIVYLSNTVDDFSDFLIRDTPHEYFKVKKVVENSLKVLDSKIKSEEIQVNINLNNEELYNYKNDLIQVLMNIITNAIYALQNNTDNKIVNIDYKIVDEVYFLVITDNGCGINSDIIDKIFDKHFSTKENEKSSGLGLYMCKKIIEDNMDGTLEVISENKETSFIVKLPINTK